MVGVGGEMDNSGGNHVIPKKLKTGGVKSMTSFRLSVFK